MASVNLVRSQFTLVLNDDDGAYVAVAFVGGGGKRVELSSKGSATNVSAWTNGPSTPTGDRHHGGDHEFTHYKPDSTKRTITIDVLKSNLPTDPPDDFDEFTDTAPPPDANFAFEAHHAVSGRPIEFRLKRWTFNDGGDQVIVTIVMLDNEGGGLGGPRLLFTLGDNEIDIPVRLIFADSEGRSRDRASEVRTRRISRT